MKERKLTKQQRNKHHKRFVIEKVNKCGTCQYLFNGECQHENIKIKRYANETACYAYKVSG